MIECVHFQEGRCTSCSLIELPYAEQLKTKRLQLEKALAPLAALAPLKPVPSALTACRNKAKMIASSTPDGLTLGLSEGVELIDCPLYTPSMQEALTCIQAWLRRLDIRAYELKTKKGELKYVLLSEARFQGDLMLRFVLRSHGIIPRLRRALEALQQQLPRLQCVSVNIQSEHKAILEGSEELFLTQAHRIEERFGAIPLFIRPKSFFQTNPPIAAKLYQSAAVWIDELPVSTLWDLFCGVGGFALHCADGKREVLGIELEEEAILAARDAAAQAGIQNIRFEAIDIDSFSVEASCAPDGIIVNPPRRGLGPSLCRWLERIRPKVLLYSSCHIDSLARDLALLSSYRIEKVQLFDMFPHTEHFETLLLLRARD
ncbi:MAG: 23S rRNA (uracil(747)-C(5))-methyltransferase RlmC [Campylobacterales bacterium]|nr:23S rRNA (uracil(747)-C(5))-methyltransferase RlmC [Campylobacterales bacterium]